jgi:hypothetical protein
MPVGVLRDHRHRVGGEEVKRLLAVVAGLALALVGTMAVAAWLSTGNGTGSVAAAHLAAPTAVSGSHTDGTGDVTVSWTASTGAPTPTGYYVLRTPTSGPAEPACGTSASTTVSATSCTDSSVPLGSFTYTVVAVFHSWTAVSEASAGVVVGRAAQTVVITSSPSSPTYGGTYALTATGGGSGNPIVFGSSTPAVCTVSGATVSFVHAGTCTLTADQDGSTYYSAAPQATQQFEVAKASQTVTFMTAAPTNAVVGGTGYTPAALGGGSGNAVTFTIDPVASTVCSISGGVVTYQHVGTCVVDADQAGNADYLAANRVQQSIAVGKGSQAINFTSPAPTGAKVNGSYTVTASGGASGNSVTFSSATPSVCSVVGPTVTFVGAGTCTINADQAGNADYLAATQVQQSFAVTKNDQTITFTSPAPDSAVFGGSYSATATSTSDLTVTFSTDTASVCTVLSGGSVSFVGTGTCHVNADQVGNTAFNAAPQVQQSFSIGKANQTISFTSTAPVSRAAGTTYTPTATATSGLTVAFTVSGACSITSGTVTFGPATGTCTINANQSGSVNYNAAPQVQQSVTVTAADTTAPVITAIEPGNEGPAGWNSIACSVGLPGNQGKICVTATDNVAVTSVTITLTKSNGRCWSGTGSTTFDSANCSTPVSLTLSGGVWVSNQLVRMTNSGQPNFNDTSYTLAVTVSDAAGNVATATRSFSINGG